MGLLNLRFWVRFPIHSFYFMLFTESLLYIFDNSNVEKVKIISLFNKQYVRAGQVVLVAVRQSKKNRVVDKKYLALITATVYPLKNKSGIFVTVDKNIAFLLKQRDTFVGTKFFGPVSLVCKSLKITNLTFLNK